MTIILMLFLAESNDACMLGLYPSSFTMLRTFSLVTSETLPLLWSILSTVPIETFAFSATCRIVMTCMFSFMIFCVMANAICPVVKK